MHRVDQTESLPDCTLCQALDDMIGNVDESPAFEDIEPQLFSIGFHLLFPPLVQEMLIGVTSFQG
jgi:hypothetical protein